MSSVARAAAPFKMGSKKVWLPESVFTLLRGSKDAPLPANRAKFRVPLNMNKFDVRDYLYNLYGLVTTDVRTQIHLTPLQRGTNAQRRKNLHLKKTLPWHRPISKKTAIVTMKEPFVYPNPPTTEKELEPFQTKLNEQMRQRLIKGRRGTSGGLMTRFQANGRL
ncbi:mitochondrial 54S ribosomal protein YmL41 [Savitreella phatthalungensis]